MNIQFESTNRCNLTCFECPNRLMKRPKQDMAQNIFDKLLSDYIVPLEGENPTIIPHKDGEPLLASNWEYMLRSISEQRPDVKIDLYTNGLFLKDEVIDVLSSLPNKVRILVSFHFRMKESPELVDYKTLCYDTLEGHLRHNHKNIDFVFVTHLHDGISREVLDEWAYYWNNVKKSFPNKLGGIHINEHINPWALTISDSHCISFSGCPYADGEHLFIGNTGNVLPCCMDLEEQIILGNIMTDSKEQIMNSREEFYAGDFSHPWCKKCQV